VLIDSGENLEAHASRIHRVASQVAGLKQIDHFVISHWHADHYGGTYKLGQLMPIRKFYDNHGAPPDNVADDPQFPVLVALYRKANRGTLKGLKPGESVPLNQASGAPQLSLRSIASDGKVIPADTKQGVNAECAKTFTPTVLDHGENAKSLVLLLQYGNFRFLDTGDLTWDMEERLVCPINLIGDIDLFQISHHGLDRSNNPKLVHSIRPRVVVLNNAPKKGAEPNTMKTLQLSPGLKTVWQLHRNIQTGEELNTDPQFIANLPPNKTAEYIKGSVQPNGAFSVQIGQNGNRQSYPPR
jgi:competence protein ComEC